MVASLIRFCSSSTHFTTTAFLTSSTTFTVILSGLQDMAVKPSCFIRSLPLIISSGLMVYVPVLTSPYCCGSRKKSKATAPSFNFRLTSATFDAGPSSTRLLIETDDSLSKLTHRSGLADLAMVIVALETVSFSVTARSAQTQIKNRDENNRRDFAEFDSFFHLLFLTRAAAPQFPGQFQNPFEKRAGAGNHT